MASKEGTEQGMNAFSKDYKPLLDFKEREMGRKPARKASSQIVLKGSMPFRSQDMMMRREK